MLTALDQLFQRYVTALVTIYLVVGIVAVAAVALAVVAFAKRYVRYGGKRIITCPETDCHEVVELDAPLAAMSSLLDGAELRLTCCSRWPERQDCGQQCIHEIEVSPIGCRLRALLDNWYKGKACLYCQRVFDEIHWFDHKPALQSPEGNILEWESVPAEDIPDLLKTHQPVCWNCKIVEKFRTEHPELVTARPRFR